MSKDSRDDKSPEPDEPAADESVAEDLDDSADAEPAARRPVRRSAKLGKSAV